jgi:hypothetical protein
MVEHDGLQVSQKKLAASAILKWEALNRRERPRERRLGRNAMKLQLGPT